MNYNHFANVQNSIVVNTLVADQDFINKLTDANNWIETDANTYGNVHYTITFTSNNKIMIADSGIPFRGNYGYIGCTYDTLNDVFYEQSPFPSWILNKSTWLWESPIPKPKDGIYRWEESSMSWIKIVMPTSNTTTSNTA